jgi:hypothetical protein
MKAEVSEVTATDGATCYQVHLIGFGFSGRVVRFRELDEETIQAFQNTASTLAGPPPAGPDSDWQRAQWIEQRQESVQRLGANRFTVEISEQPVDVKNYPGCTDVKFKKMTAQLMQQMGAGLLKFKDLEMLKQLYSKLHHVTFGEVQDLMGKAIQVV